MIVSHLTSNPRTKRELSQLVGCPTREVELMVQQARLEGAPILSSGDGYWLSQNPDEVRACAQALRRRLVNQAKTSRALLHTAKRLEGDPVLWSDL